MAPARWTRQKGQQKRTKKGDTDPIHPGEHLAELLEELEISQYRLSKEVGVPQMRISEIVRGKRGITADTALRFGRFFGTSAQFWLNLQSQHDLEMAEDALGPALEKVHEYTHPTA